MPVAVAVALSLVLATAAATLAYWAVGGFGSASASTLVLDPPTAVTATFPNQASRTVHVTWTGHAAPGGGNPTGYYVQRLAGATPSPACGSSPTSPLSGAAGTCDDPGVASGTYTYVVTAVFRTWTAASTPSAAVTVPVPALASFSVVPSTLAPTAGSGITLAVTAIDQYGATMTSYAGVQCVTLGGAHDAPGGAGPTYPAAGSCGSGSSVTFTSGAATVPVTLVAAETTTISVVDNATATSGTTASIAVGPGAASRLAFSVQPSTPTAAGSAFAAQPRVTVQDAYGNTVTGDTSAVTLAVTGGGALVSGCSANPVAAVAGVATFAGCRVTTAGTFTLAATGGALTGATSAGFTITAGAASRLAFTVSPTGSVPGVPFPVQPKVAIRDAYGNTVTTATNPVTLAVTGGGTTVTCTANPVAAVAGVASFAGCRINVVGTGYTLRATSGVLTAGTSAAFNITTALAPTGIALANKTGGTRDQIEPGDQMTISFAGTLKASTLCSTWPSDTTAYSASDGTLTLVGQGGPAGDDEILLSTSTSCGGALNFGYVDLESTAVVGGTGSYTWNATIAWDPSTDTLTVAVGALTSGTPPVNTSARINRTYHPSATLTDPLGIPISGTATNRSRFF